MYMYAFIIIVHGVRNWKGLWLYMFQICLYYYRFHKINVCVHVLSVCYSGITYMYIHRWVVCTDKLATEIPYYMHMMAQRCFPCWSINTRNWSHDCTCPCTHTSDLVYLLSMITPLYCATAIKTDALQIQDYSAWLHNHHDDNEYWLKDGTGDCYWGHWWH